MKLAPIVLFVYNRPQHTRQTVEALKQNELANQSDLFVFSDGPKSVSDKAKVDEVREYIHNIKGFRSINITERPHNLGLAESIITGVTEIVNKFGRVIVLEDDLVTSAHFLKFMNEALNLYENEPQVISIHGYTYPVKGKLPETFFLRGADCLGWATWKRGWDLFEVDGERLLTELKARKLTRQFDFDGAYRYTLMLKLQIVGLGNSWAIRWYAAAFLRERLTLYPGSSLVRHIGNDGTGANYGTSKALDVELANRPITVGSIDIAENPEAKRIVGDYLRRIKTPIAKAALNQLWKYLSGVLTKKR